MARRSEDQEELARLALEIEARQRGVYVATAAELAESTRLSQL